MGCNTSSTMPLAESEKFPGTGFKVMESNTLNSSVPENSIRRYKMSLTNGIAAENFSKNRIVETILETVEPEAETPEKGTNEENRNKNKGDAIVLPPLAFHVPVNEESLIKKHPPRKLKRLQSQQIENSKILTRQDLDAKLEEANARRKEILNERIRSARQKNGGHYRQLIRECSQKSFDFSDNDNNIW